MFIATIARFFKKHADYILHILITLLLSAGLTILLNKYPDYKWITNLGIGIYIAYNIYRMVFKRYYVLPFLKIICALFILVIVNEFYSYPKLAETLHLPKSLEPNTFIAIAIGFILVLCIVMKLLAYKEADNDQSKKDEAKETGSCTEKTGDRAISSSPHSASTEIKENSEHDRAKIDPPKDAAIPVSVSVQKKRSSKEDFYSFLKFLIVLAICAVFIVIPMIWLYHFNTSNPPDSILDFGQIFSFLLCNGVSFLLIIATLLAVAIILISVGKYIAIQIRSIKQINDQEEKSQNSVPTYALSIIIVVILMLLGWKVSDFSLDDLTEILIMGDYLAFPVAVIVLLILFYILVQLVHAIILMLGKMKSQNIVEFLNNSDHELKFTKRVVMILKDVVDIILDTILTTLSFIKFVPDFFSAMQKMVLQEDGNTEDEDSKTQPKGDKDTDMK